MISRRQLAATILRRLDAGDSKQLTRSIAAYLVQYRRSGELNELMRDIKELRAENGIVEADITTAHALRVDMRDRIESFVQQMRPTTQRVIVNENVDSAVIGGIRIVAAGMELDATVQEKLKKLKRV